MKNYILNLLVGVCAVSLGQLSFAHADELSQFNAQVQVMSDAIDAHMQEFSRKSTSEAAFDHADYLRARQKYYESMKVALQQFKNETLEIYGRFEPYFKLANSSFYSDVQKWTFLKEADSPLQEVVAKARVDYTYAFEKLLIQAMGDVYYRILTKGGGIPRTESGAYGRYFYVDKDLVVCNSAGCLKKINLLRDREKGYRNDTQILNSNLKFFRPELLHLNQEHLKKTLGCETFHCFTLMKSDMVETFASLWIEFGLENRSFYLDEQKRYFFLMGLVPSDTIGGIMSNCEKDCEEDDLMGGRSLWRRMREQVDKLGWSETVKSKSDAYYYVAPFNKEKVWNYDRIYTGHHLIQILFEPLVSPVRP